MIKSDLRDSKSVLILNIYLPVVVVVSSSTKCEFNDDKNNRFSSKPTNIVVPFFQSVLHSVLDSSPMMLRCTHRELIICTGIITVSFVTREVIMINEYIGQASDIFMFHETKIYLTENQIYLKITTTKNSCIRLLDFRKKI